MTHTINDAFEILDGWVVIVDDHEERYDWIKLGRHSYRVLMYSHPTLMLNPDEKKSSSYFVHKHASNHLKKGVEALFE